MPVPPNQTPTTAINIGALTGYTPYTATPDAFDSNSMLTADLWYAYTPVAGDTGLEIYGYGNGTTYIPHTTVYTGPASSPVQLDNSHDSQSRPIQQDIQTFRATGEDILIKFAQQGGLGNPNPSTLTIRIARWQNEPINPGDLYINDSSPGYPGIVMDPADAIPKRYSLNYPAGEGQQILQNGIVGVIDAFTALGPVLYDVAIDGFTVRATPTMPDTHYTESLSSNQIDTFWAFRRFGVGNSFAVSIDQNGVVGTPLDLGFDSIGEGVPQADNSALYCIRGAEIKKITNPGGVGTTFLSVSAEGANLLMLTDDTLVVGVDNGGLLDLQQYNLSGTLINTITTAVTASLLERIFADDEDPLYVWIWWQTSTLNRFQKYRVSDGSLITDLSRMKFIESVSQTTDLTDAPEYSGADFSCVPIVLRGSSVTTQTFTIRRQRRFLLPTSPDHKLMRIPTIELLMRTGIGLTPDAWDSLANSPQGANPQVLLRVSKDGGKTWSPERWVSAGLIGQYKDRVRITRATGNYRDAVFEVTVTDPVDWQFLAAMGEPIEGNS